MEDSGFDSEDRLNFMNFRNNNESGNSSNDDNLKFHQKTDNNNDFDEVLYCNPSIAKTGSKPDETISNSVPTSSQLNEHNKKLSHISTCKGLQRKLELKVEKAKKHFGGSSQAVSIKDKCVRVDLGNDPKRSSDNLIPINRLQFPRNEIQPLISVELKSDSDDEDTTFFPINKKHRRLRSKQRRDAKRKDVEVDTFSIQEMTIIESDESDGNEGDESGSDGDCDSQLNLELLTPKSNGSFLEKFKRLICCTRTSNNVF